MKKRIKKIFCLSTTVTISLLYFVVSALISWPLAVYYLTAGSQEADAKELAISFFSLPFINGLLTVVFVLVICFFYNAVAKGTGGIKIKLEDE